LFKKISARYDTSVKIYVIKDNFNLAGQRIAAQKWLIIDFIDG